MNLLNINSLVASIYSTGVKKLFLELLQERYALYESTINDIARNVNNEEEYKRIGQLLIATYEAGYIKAVEQHREALAKCGLRAKVVEPKEPPPPIFK